MSTVIELADRAETPPVSEYLPSRPQRASAGRRRRHRTQLAWRLGQVAPGAVTVLLIPVWTEAACPMERVYVVVARDRDGRHLGLPEGGSRRIAALVQGAHPQADWDQPQTWRASTGTVTRWSPPGPDFAASVAAGLTESLAAYTARTSLLWGA